MMKVFLLRRFINYNLFRTLRTSSYFKTITWFRECFMSKPRTLLALTTPALVKVECQNAKLSDNATSDCECLEPNVLMRNATVCAVNAATSLLTHSACRLLQLEAEYVKALQDMLVLLEAELTVLENEHHRQQIWDALLTVRHQVSRIKQDKMNTEAVFQSAVRMLESAAEAAHASGVDYAGVAGSERLFSARSQVSLAGQRSRKLEQEVRRQEVKNIEATFKHAEEMRKKEEVEQKEPKTESEIGGKTQSVESESETGGKSKVSKVKVKPVEKPKV